MMKINNPPWELMAKGKGTNNTASGPIVTFRGNGAPLRSLLVNIEPVQEGSGEPSPDNVRPISGWSEANVWRTGKNLLNIGRETAVPSPSDVYASPRVMSTEKAYVGLRKDNYYYAGYVTEYSNVDGVIKLTTRNNVQYGVGFPVECKQNADYTLSAVKSYGSIGAGFYDEDWNYISSTALVTDSSLTFTTPSNAKYVSVILASIPIGTEGTFTNIQLELGSTATPYEPYQGDTYTIQLGQTVYGATLDVKNGVLTVDRVSESFRWGDYKATDDFTVTTRRRFAISDIAVYPASGENRPYCNVAKWAENYTSDTVHFYCNSIRQALVFLPIGTPDSTEIQIVYTLATPITIPLTPTQISTLQGQNNVWADSGDVELTYKSNFPDKSLMKLAIAFINRR